MNHAANNIEAKSKKLMELLFRRKYQVKYFQREYNWQKNNIEDLLVDLERSFMANFNSDHTRDNVPEYDCYYMGPIVLYREKTSFVIVDGQQRLTSFTLLLIYLNHLQKEIFKGNPKKIQNLNEYIFSQPYESETFNLEIPEREPILKCLFEGSEVKDFYIENISSQNIYDRYCDIEDLFSPMLKHEIVFPLFINWLVEKLIFIEILAQTSDSAYTIFESMNDRGLKLTQSELLKSYLLSNVKDEEKVKELDISWKKKITLLKTYGIDEDQDFFKAWLRAKYAITMRSNEKGATNQDFEKIGTRFSNWVQESSKKLLNLDKEKPETYYFFVESDFHFFVDIYITLMAIELSDSKPEHILKLMSYKGVSSSLSYPLIISPITKIDDENTIDKKIELSTKFLDSFAVYRLLLKEPITQTSIDYGINRKIKDVRDNELDTLESKYKEEIDTYKKKFLSEINYIDFDITSSKYILSRLFKNEFPEYIFENIYFQRKKASLALYQFFTYNDVDNEVHKIPNKLKDIFVNSLCSYSIVPKDMTHKLDSMKLINRIQYLINSNYMIGVKNTYKIEPDNLKDYFIQRNKILKEMIVNCWKI